MFSQRHIKFALKKCDWSSVHPCTDWCLSLQITESKLNQKLFWKHLNRHRNNLEMECHSVINAKKSWWIKKKKKKKKNYIAQWYNLLWNDNFISHFTCICTVFYTIQRVSKQLHINKEEHTSVAKFINYENTSISAESSSTADNAALQTLPLFSSIWFSVDSVYFNNSIQK